MAEPEKDPPIIEEIDSEDEEDPGDHSTNEYTVEDIDENFKDEDSLSESLSSRSSTPNSDYSLAEDDSLEEDEGTNQNPVKSNQKKKLSNKNQPNVNQEDSVANQNPVEADLEDVDYSDDFSDEDSLEMEANPVDSLEFEKDTDLDQVQINLDSDADTEEKPTQDEDIHSTVESPIPEELYPIQDDDSQDSDELTEDSEDDRPLTARRVSSQDNDLSTEFSKDTASANSKDLPESNESNAGNDWTDRNEDLPETFFIQGTSVDSQAQSDPNADDIFEVSDEFSDDDSPSLTARNLLEVPQTEEVQNPIAADDLRVSDAFSEEDNPPLTAGNLKVPQTVLSGNESQPSTSINLLEAPVSEYAIETNTRNTTKVSDEFEDDDAQLTERNLLEAPDTENLMEFNANGSFGDKSMIARNLDEDIQANDKDQSDFSDELSDSEDALAVTIKENIRVGTEEPSPIIQVVQLQKPLLDFVQFVEPEEEDASEDVYKDDGSYPWVSSPSKDYVHSPNANNVNKTRHPSTAATKDMYSMHNVETTHPQTSSRIDDFVAPIRAQGTQNLIDFDDDETDNASNRRSSFQQQFGEELVGDAKDLVGQYQQQLEDALESEEAAEQANQDWRDSEFTDNLMEPREHEGHNMKDLQNIDVDTFVEPITYTDTKDSQKTNEEYELDLKDPQNFDVDVFENTQEQSEGILKGSQSFDDDLPMALSEQKEHGAIDSESILAHALIVPTEQLDPYSQDAQGIDEDTLMEGGESQFSQESKIIDVDSLMEQEDLIKDANDDTEESMDSSQETQRRRHFSTKSHNDEADLNEEDGISSDSDAGRRLSDDSFGAYDDSSTGSCYSDENVAITTKMSPAEIVSKYSNEYSTYYESSEDDDAPSSIVSDVLENVSSGRSVTITSKNHASNTKSGSCSETSQQTGNGLHFDYSEKNPFTEVPDLLIDNGSNFDPEDHSSLTEDGIPDLEDNNNIDYLQIPDTRISHNGTIPSQYQNLKTVVPFETSANISGHITKVNNWTYPTKGNVQFKNEYPLRTDNFDDNDHQRKKFQFKIDNHSDRIPTPIPTLEETDQNFPTIPRKSELQEQLNFNYNKNRVSNIDKNLEKGSMPTSTVLTIATTLTEPVSEKEDCLYSKPNIYYNYQRPASRSPSGLVSSYHQFYPHHKDSVSQHYSSSSTQVNIDLFNKRSSPCPTPSQPKICQNTHPTFTPSFHKNEF
ncbi:hypothetical protein LOTGIDRAFT_169114 [Lottia gigantea]|uniref:Uncharacterized protein n=1 Tax=Lottia gigantea TaxID=225164 RepID=V4B598_LOTGI|nr:hypothetical protein LOTGIDRAFT_169114 [Lottia gigantea]ESO83639.1 hypothetical protein LOTGIDRAFT_169114 [Lottia gigantea]